MTKQMSMWLLFCLKILGEYQKKIVGCSLIEFMLVAETNRVFFSARHISTNGKLVVWGPMVWIFGISF